MYWLKLEKLNSTVTDYYLHIIGSALEKIGNEVQYCYDWRDIKSQRNDIVLVITAPNALRAILMRRKFIFWAQGIWPEESNMRHQSKIRLYLCSKIEKIALQRAEKLFLVSETMKKHFERKYRLNLNTKCYIMPCSNDVIHLESFNSVNKYSENVFCFVGSISVWQCFEETIKLYGLIENKCKNTKLLLLVKEKDKALFYIKKYNVSNYEIDYVPIEQLKIRLSNVKFGFVLRKKDPVNYVATPTKVLTYITNGIVPIYSDSLAGIDYILKGTKYKIKLKNNDNVSEINYWLNNQIDRDLLLREYKKIYDLHYNKEMHEKNIGMFLKNNMF